MFGDDWFFRTARRSIQFVDPAGTNLAFHRETLNLARGSSRQIPLPDLIAANSFRGGQLNREFFYVEAENLFRVDDFSLLQHIKVWNHDGVQTLGGRIAGTGLEAENTNLLDERRFQVMGFNLLG